MKELVTAYKAKADVKQVQSSGLHVGGERYVVLKADDRSLYGKKVHTSPETTDRRLGLTQTQGKEGIVIVKTTQAILVTHYPETVQPGSAANTVEQLADYLIGVGY